jgi:hypothetical protein
MGVCFFFLISEIKLMFFNKFTIRKEREKTMLKKIFPKSFLFMAALVTVLILPVSAIAETLIEPVDIVPYGSFSAPKKHMDPYRAIDNNEKTKMLNFAKEGNGFTVTFDKAVVVNEIEFTTANNAPGRDPTEVEIWGSNQSEQNGFTKIADVPLTRVKERFTPYGGAFTNETANKYYRVVITGIVRANANSYQFAEVDFYSNPIEAETYNAAVTSCTSSDTPVTCLTEYCTNAPANFSEDCATKLADAENAKAEAEQKLLAKKYLQKECLAIQDEGLDPGGHLMCLAEEDCVNQGFSWVKFNFNSDTGRLGCWGEKNAPGLIEARAKAAATAFIGDRALCTASSAWQKNCPLKVDVGSCFTLGDLSDMTGNRGEVTHTPDSLGTLIKLTPKCQEVMDKCSATAWSNRVKKESWHIHIADHLDYQLTEVRRRAGKKENEIVGNALFAFTTASNLLNSDFKGASENFADFVTNDLYSCAKGLTQVDGANGISEGLSKVLECELVFLNFMTGGLSGLVVDGIELQNELGMNGLLVDGIGTLVDYASPNKCVFNVETYDKQMLSLEAQHDFDDPWGMFGEKSFRANASNASLALVEDCEARHYIGATCHPTSGIAGLETAEAKSRCPEDKWTSFESCPVSTQAIDEKVIAVNMKYGYGYTNSEYTIISDPPKTDATNHIWDGLTIEPNIPCDVPIMQLSLSQRDQCEDKYFSGSCSNIVGIGKACINPNTGTPKWDASTPRDEPRQINEDAAIDCCKRVHKNIMGMKKHSYCSYKHVQQKHEGCL